ncbi:MAG: CHASE2 domain-containing protein, partial [Aliarcobacter cryaerophilus]
YSFDIEDNNSSNNSPQIPAIFIELNKNSDTNYLIQAFGTTLNLPILQENSYSSGFFNIIPDESGVIRSVPLLISYNDTLYPSLALEIIRALNDIQKVFVNYDENGVSNIQLGDFYIPTDKFGRIFINYRGPSKSFKYISAKDIYNNNFKAEDIDGKIALLGT